MKHLTLLLYLRDDPANTLRSRISWLTKEQDFPSLEGRDDAALIGNNAFFVDQTTAHGIFVQLCADLVSSGHPYLLLPLDAESLVAVGKFPETIKAILGKNNVPFSTP